MQHWRSSAHRLQAKTWPSSHYIWPALKVRSEHIKTYLALKEILWKRRRLHACRLDLGAQLGWRYFRWRSFFLSVLFSFAGKKGPGLLTGNFDLSAGRYYNPKKWEWYNIEQKNIFLCKEHKIMWSRHYTLFITRIELRQRTNLQVLLACVYFFSHDVRDTADRQNNGDHLFSFLAQFVDPRNVWQLSWEESTTPT